MIVSSNTRTEDNDHTDGFIDYFIVVNKNNICKEVFAMIVPRFYEDLNVMHDKTMSARAYYIPASKSMNDLVEHRETSDRFQFG